MQMQQNQLVYPDQEIKVIHLTKATKVPTNQPNQGKPRLST